jgi:cholesterol transport system auxiliary component
MTITDQIARRGVLTGMGALVLSGCGSILPAPQQPQLYLLDPTITAPAGPPVRWRLAVATPDASAALDTARIALMRTPTTMDYYANAAWQDRVPLILQRLLIEAFESSGRILSVDRDTAGIESDYVLETEIRAFEARYEAAIPQIQVTIAAKMVQMPMRDIIATFTANRRIDASANTVNAVVMAFDTASAQTITQIVSWAFGLPAPARA